MSSTRFQAYKDKVAEIRDLIRNTYKKEDWIFAIAYECNKLAFRGCLGSETDEDVMFFKNQAPECPGCIMRKMEVHVYETLGADSTMENIKEETLYHRNASLCKGQKFAEWRQRFEEHRKANAKVEQFMEPTLRRFLMNGLAKHQLVPLVRHISEKSIEESNKVK